MPSKRTWRLCRHVRLGWAVRTPQDVQVGQVPVALLQIEPIADEQLVGHCEAHVPDGEVVDEPAVRAVEEGHCGQRGRVPKRQCLAEVVQRQSRVDDVLDDQDVAAGDLRVQILEKANPGMAAPVGACGVAGELDEVDPVVDSDRTGQIGDEDNARLERRYQQRLATLVITRDLATELTDPRP